MLKPTVQDLKNCLNDIRGHQPLYPAERGLAPRDRWIQYKYWVKNYARMASLLTKVGGPLKLAKGLRDHPWLYDMLKANIMYQRAVYGRSGNYREAISELREARHVVVRARLDGVPRTIELYVMKKDGCVYDLGYVAPPDRYESGRGAFDAFVRGFHVTRSPMGPR